MKTIVVGVVLDYVDEAFDSRMSDMEFSSMDPGAERVGYKATQLLERLLRREPAPSAPILKDLTKDKNTDVAKASVEIVKRIDPNVGRGPR